MSEMKNVPNKDKRTIILYALVLFLCAFAILTITLVSQERYNQSINNYEDKIQDEKNISTNYLNNLSSAKKEIERLQAEIVKRDELIGQQEVLLSETDTQKQTFADTISALEDQNALALDIMAMFLSGDYNECYNKLTSEDCPISEEANPELRKQMLDECILKITDELYDLGKATYDKHDYETTKEIMEKIGTYTQAGETYEWSICYLLLCYEFTDEQEKFDTLLETIKADMPQLLDTSMLSRYRNR